MKKNHTATSSSMGSQLANKSTSFAVLMASPIVVPQLYRMRVRAPAID
jgi:hypothetical protein